MLMVIKRVPLKHVVQVLVNAVTVHVKPQYGICRLQKREARLWR